MVMSDCVSLCKNVLLLKTAFKMEFILFFVKAFYSLTKLLPDKNTDSMHVGQVFYYLV